MAYVITATMTFASQANRDSGQTRVNNALFAYSKSDRATAFPAGVVTSGTTGLTVSVELPDNAAASAATDVYNAIINTSRPTTVSFALSKI